MSDDQVTDEIVSVLKKDSKKHKPVMSQVNGESVEPTNGEEKAEGEKEEEEEEVEALSHKEMRRRRKAEKAAVREGQEGSNMTNAPPVHPSRAAAVALANNIASSDNVTRRSKHSVWVGNLLFSTSAERLQDWFEQRGVTGISRVNMPQGQKRTDHNRGFAYVDIPSADALQTCIDLSESNLDGRRLLIKSGTDYTGRPEIDRKAVELAGGINASDAASGDAGAGPLQKGKTGLTKTAQKILRAQKHSPGPTLFIGNLSFNTTEENLREMIERSAAARDEWSNGKAKWKAEEKMTKKKKNRKTKEDDSDDDNSSESSESEGESSDESEQEKAKKEDDAVEDAKKKKEKAKKADGLRGAGIRKIRMGQFEDTGKCKGFAFIDFFSPAYATASLIDPHNGKLDGRDLLLQFASADAVRRGAPKGQIAPGPRLFRDNKKMAPFKRRHEDAFVDKMETKQDLGPAPEPGTFDPEAPIVKKHKETQEERQKRREAQGTGTRRLKPGAALANAQRGKTSIAIDAPQGIKKTFD